MKRFLFFLLVVIAANAETVSACSAAFAPPKPDQEVILHGNLFATGYPCTPNTMCPDCLVPALKTSEGEYYLNNITEDDLIKLGFDYFQKPRVIVTGVIAKVDGFPYIEVSSIKAENEAYNAFVCNRWNILYNNGGSLGPIYGEKWTSAYKLEGDTTINDITYSKLMYAEGFHKTSLDSFVYRAAIRSNEKQEVYILPKDSKKEFLLYAFNANEGDKLENLYVSRANLFSCSAVVKEKDSDSKPSRMKVDIYISTNDTKGKYLASTETWICGVGPQYGMFLGYDRYMMDGLNFGTTLCVYDDDNLMFSFASNPEYGCEYWEESIYMQQIKAYEPMLVKDRVWNYYYEYYEHYREYETVRDIMTYQTMISDSVKIEDKTYYRLDELFYNIGSNLKPVENALFREDKEKHEVYVIQDEKKSQEEQLLYKFNLNEGDTLLYPTANYGLEYYTVDTKQCRYAVTKIDSIQGHKAIYFDVLLPYTEEWLKKNGITDKYMYTEDIWVEGIGSLYGGIAGHKYYPDERTWGMTGIYYDLLCAIDDDEIYYQSDRGKDMGCYVDEWHAIDEASGTEFISVSDVPDTEQPMYNVLGIPVTPEYKGIIIQKGKKFLGTIY